MISNSKAINGCFHSCAQRTTVKSTKSNLPCSATFSIIFTGLFLAHSFHFYSRGPLTEHERSLLSQGKFDALVEHQKKLDAAIDAEVGHLLLAIKYL